MEGIRVPEGPKRFAPVARFSWLFPRRRRVAGSSSFATLHAVRGGCQRTPSVGQLHTPEQCDACHTLFPLPCFLLACARVLPGVHVHRLILWRVAQA